MAMLNNQMVKKKPLGGPILQRVQKKHLEDVSSTSTYLWMTCENGLETLRPTVTYRIKNEPCGIVIQLMQIEIAPIEIVVKPMAIWIYSSLYKGGLYRCTVKGCG